MASCRSSWLVSLTATHLKNMKKVVTTASSLVAVPHAVTEDDVYAGFFIPKGES